MNKILLLSLLILTSTSALANTTWKYMDCDGVDKAGNKVTVKYYDRASDITINGSKLRITGRTQDNKGLVTETFLIRAGFLVYDTIVPYRQTGAILSQYNAANQNLLASVKLQCKFHN